MPMRVEMGRSHIHSVFQHHFYKCKHYLMAANHISPLIILFNFNTLAYFKKLAGCYTALLWWLIEFWSDILSFSNSVFIQEKRSLWCLLHGPLDEETTGASGGGSSLALCHSVTECVFSHLGEPLFSRHLCVWAPQERIHGKSHFAVNSNLLFCRWNL